MAGPESEPSGEQVTAGQAAGTSVGNDWLPRLKLPPSLAPFDDLPVDETPVSTSPTHFTSAPVIRDDELGEPFRAEHSGWPLEDDLPADAGLADLLARALAEHRAGTASAASLVKRIGGQNTAEGHTVNGYGRNGDSPGSGRHRGDT